MDVAKLIEKYFDCFNDKNWAGMLALLDERIQHDICQGPTQRGLEPFKNFLSTMDEYYDEKISDIKVMVCADQTQAAAEFTCSGRYKKTCPGEAPARGQTYNLRVGTFFSLQGDKIVRISTHYNRQDWQNQVK